MSTETYRGFEIAPDRSGYGWIWSHPEYNGPGDKRCGHGKDAEDCRREIDMFSDD